MWFRFRAPLPCIDEIITLGSGRLTFMPYKKRARKASIISFCPPTISRVGPEDLAVVDKAHAMINPLGRNSLNLASHYARPDY